MKKLSSYEKAEMCERALEDSGLIPKAYLSDKKEWLIKVIDYCGERISQPDKIIEYAGFLFKKEIEFDLKSAKKHLYKENAITSLEIMIDFLEKTDSFNRESLEEQTKIISEKSGIKLGKLIQPLRIACTGSAVSFGIFEILETLGKEETIRRAVLALEAAKKNIQ
jgi:glutamyl-tRNA synthetase